MSNWRVDNISDRAGTGSPNIVGGELCRARSNLNGTGTIAPRDDFNVASYVDNGVGDYTFNFSTAFPNANYAYNIGAGDASISDPYVARRQASPLTTTAIRALGQSASAGTLVDISEACLQIVGDRP